MSEYPGDGPMKIGIAFHSTDLAMHPVELAQEAEARGFHSLYIPEHTHIPTSRRTPAPTGTPELGQEYLRSPDPYVCLLYTSPSPRDLSTSRMPSSA